MTIFSGVVVYILIWWMVFFCVLPIGIQTIERVEHGAMPGAPINPAIKRKALWTTGIATLLWFVAYFVISSNLISFREIAARMAM